jgi:TonB-linked SusC/RagA family outer membrane protein
MKLRTWCIRIGQILTKTVLIFTGFLVCLTLFNPAKTKAENNRGGITIRQQNAPIEKVFQSIEKQSGYRFFYNETLLLGAGKVTINLQNVTLQEALDACFHNQPLSYAIVDKTIIVKRRQEQQRKAPEAAAVALSGPGKIIALRGKVTSGNAPVAGASIMIKGTDNGASTDKDGMFTLPEVEDDATLVVSSVSHQAREVRLNGQTFIRIDLSTKTSDLDEALVVAYNTTTRKMNTGSVAVVKGEEIAALPNRSFDKSLQGLVPGLLVTQGSGLPGGPVTNFVIRGIATAVDPSMGSTVRNPLIVIDGVPVTQDQFQIYLDQTRTPISNPLAQLNPSDIETISILKDASAIALYGSRASNGVIVIVTKRGKAGRTNINFRHQTDFASRFQGNVKLLNQDEYLELLFEAYRNLNSPQFPDDAAIYADLRKKFPVIVNAPGDTSFYPAADWVGALLREKAATVSNEISLSGGNEKSNYYLNFEYSKQNGVVIGTDYDRKSLRFNFENRPASWLKLGLNNTLSYSIQNYGIGNRSYTGTVVNNMSPLNPVRYSDGSYVLNYAVGAGPQSATLFPNPAAAAEFNINRNTAYRGLTTLNGEISFLKYFKFSTIAGLDFMLAEGKEKADPRLVDPGNFSSTGVGRIEQQDVRRANIVSTNMLRYNALFNNDHSIGVLIGQEAQIQTQKNSLIAVQNLTLPYYDQVNSPGVTALRQTATSNKETLLSFFSQANYAFRNKYFLSGSIRKDGSSRFGEDKRYGTFWSAGAGWILTSERFLKGASAWMDYLKIRGSIGAAGNAGAISAITKYDQLEPYRFLGETAVVPSTTPGNPNVHWEQTFTWDAGLEARFWKERISLTADVYHRRTKDLIYSENLAASTGYVSVLNNIGIMENRGVEFSLSANIIKNRDLNWVVDVNWSTNKNKLIKANVPTAALSNSILGSMEGKNFNSFYMPVWAGVNAGNGKAQWLDSAGEVIEVYSSAAKDKKFVGKPQPDGFGAFGTKLIYRGVELSARFCYQYGYQVFIQDDLVSDGRYPYMNQDRRALDRWQKPGQITTNPRRVLNNSTGSAVLNPSTRYLFDGDHIRLQNVSIAYAIPKLITEKLRLNSCRVFLQGNNLALWTEFPGQDPDIITTIGGTGNNSFPSQRSFSFGINANF